MNEQSMGDRIRICREACGYSQVWLANELGVDRSTVFRYENGSTRRIAASTIEKIAELLGTTRDYLLFGIEPGSRPIPSHSSGTSWQLRSPPPAYDVLFREFQVDSTTVPRMRAMHVFRFLVESDLMVPRIQRGDILTVEVSDQLQNQRLHLFLHEGAFLLRRVSCEGDVVILVSRDGSVEVLDQEKLQNKYQLIGHVTNLSSDRP